ncbi:SusC/RagA family TonB-linked outer membrane protein [Flavobacteriaceae bacterium Ap0902]|nr:SusC/RagA family TonB-linked outer membrane protein [Flavobacteriaceae bacterium Ap0902]
MRMNIKLFCTAMLLAGTVFSWAQEKNITGHVTDSNGFPVSDAYVYVEGTENGVYTDANGNYSLSVDEGDTVAIEFIGYETQTLSVTDANNYNVSLTQGGIDLGTTVATALGIEREKKSLGYATQEISGDDISNATGSNFADALSGEVAGLNTQSFGGMGGSTNIVIRGYSSLTGSNQALIIVDGTPILNDTNNDVAGDQAAGRGGYDYGNGATDINPEDIESINVLKGSAATALYGSRAANGAIIITTKKGKSRGVGITFNTSFTAGFADKETLPKYQNKYGAGYGPYYESADGYFNTGDFDGDGQIDEVVPFTEDASYGAAFDPDRLVLQWFNIYPDLPGYQQLSPWVAADKTPNDFLKPSFTFENSISFGNSTPDGSYRLAYTNFDHAGILPNSKLDRNTVNFSGAKEFTDKLNVSSSVTYTNTQATGRYGTGYSSMNPFQQFRQWWQSNVDLDQLKEAYESTNQNITWNPNSEYNLSPKYSDNPYWTRYHNYQDDSRDRVFGNASLDYEVADWVTLLGRVSLDTYSTQREERIDVGSADVSNYTVFNQNAREINYDLMSSFNHDFSDDINFDGNIGWNLRVIKNEISNLSTNGGLGIPGLFTLDNTKSPLSQDNIYKYLGRKKVDGIYARASVGFYDTYFVEGTIRRDRSSSLPIENNTYYYPSISGSYLFSNDINSNWLTFGKLRANWAKVGSDTDPFRILHSYRVSAPINGLATARNPSLLNNPNLKPEFSTETEFGVELRFAKNRLGFDLSYYNRKTEDLISFIDVSTASGYQAMVLNAGDVRNKGVELFMDATPIKTKDFSWSFKVNFAKNTSEVLSLYSDLEFLSLANVQGGVSIGAYVGQPFGVILGRDYIYDDAGNKVVEGNGHYARTAQTNYIIGDVNPDWTGGFKNTINFKGLSASFLIDVQQGGDVFSLDTYYGYATGLYDFTAGVNDLGNPVRDAVTDGNDSGGVILDGVQADYVLNPDGSYTVTNATPNGVRASQTTYANSWGYVRAPSAAHVYDASFVKLREASISYQIPEKLYKAVGIDNLTFSLIGRNLWIIHKNVPYADPEAGLGAGNVQGYQSGAYPSVREIGASLKVEF